MTAAVETPVEQGSGSQGLLTNLVSVFGLGALASDTPGAPIGTPIVMALLALGTRRESESVTTLTQDRSRGQLTGRGARVDGCADGRGRRAVRSVDVLRRHPDRRQRQHLDHHAGHRAGGLNNTPEPASASEAPTSESCGTTAYRTTRPPPSNEHQVLILFGDTFSNTTPVRTGVWRNNMLFRSSDNMLSNGMYVQDGSVPIDRHHCRRLLRRPIGVQHRTESEHLQAGHRQ